MYLLYNGLARYNEQQNIIINIYYNENDKKLLIIDPKVDDLTINKWLKYNIYYIND